MRILLVLILCVINLLAFGVEFETLGRDGWVARIRFEDPAKIKTPVFITFSDGKTITNMEVLASVKETLELNLGLPDGGYEVGIVDGEKNFLLKRKFELVTPFRAQITNIGPDSADFHFTPVGRETVKWELTAVDNKTISWSGSFTGTRTNIRAEGLSAGTAYRMEFISGNYSRSLFFKTGDKNVALNRPITGTFTRQPDSRFIDDSSPAITRVNDGRLEWLGGMAASGEVNTGDQYVYIQLEKKTAVRKFRVYWHAFYYPSVYYILYGMDGKKWVSVRRDAKNFKNEIAPDNTPVKVDEFEPGKEVGAAFAGLVVKKGEKLMNRDRSRNYVELMEFEIDE